VKIIEKFRHHCRCCHCNLY